MLKLIGRDADCPGATVTPLASVMSAPATTVKLKAELWTLGTFTLAVIVVEPLPTAVTGTVALVEEPPKVTDAGTVATLELPEPRDTIKPPPGAGDERCSVRFC